ncbi:MAG TPA: molybdopterin-dependent oxidoreductase, partial [Rhizobiaceae bacterium]|nr:molybdopterin-dependent oxidoreductase [Rhizobiaceae bacterium]
ELRYEYQALGAGPATLKAVADGRVAFAETLAKAARPMVIVGQGALARPDGAAVLSMAARIAADCGAITEDWNGFAVLHTAASRVGGLDIGFVPGAGGRSAREMLGALKVVFLLGADELDMSAKGETFVVYVGSHGDAGAHGADVILPAAAYTEKSATYVNTEGRVQRTARAGFAPGEAREDWAILRALSDVLGKKLPYDSLAALRAAMIAAHPHLGAIGAVAAADPGAIAAVAKKGGAVGDEPFASTVKDFYLTNPIARASAVMAECSALAAEGFRHAAE